MIGDAEPRGAWGLYGPQGPLTSASRVGLLSGGVGRLADGYAWDAVRVYALRQAPTEAAIAQLFAAAATGNLKLVKKSILYDGLVRACSARPLGRPLLRSSPSSFFMLFFQNVNVESVRGRTPLDLAAMHGHVEVAKFLVANGGCLQPNWSVPRCARGLRACPADSHLRGAYRCCATQAASH